MIKPHLNMRIFPFLYLILILAACHSPQACLVPDDYAQQQQTWRDERFSELLAPTGWIALVGLHWLAPGQNAFGSDSTNQIIISPAAPAHLGTFTLDGNRISAQLEPGVSVDGTPATQWTWAPGQPMPMMQKDQWTWTLIERGSRYAIRLWDTSIPMRIRMRPIPHYPDDVKWVLPARWIPAAQPETQLVRNALGMDVPTTVLGKMALSWEGNTHELLAFEGGENQLFIIFTDQTSGETSYPAGRYLYCPKPATAGPTCLDFNQAQSPPCAFTEYATCLLPPPGNDLPINLTAGEMYEGED